MADPNTLPTLANRPAARSQPKPWLLQDILDGRKLRVQLTAAALDNIGNEKEARARVLDLLHAALFRGRMIAQERLQQGADGLDTARLLSAVQDEVIGALYDYTTVHVFRARNPTEGEKLAVLATGGYGRSVLAPSSDIDLLFLRKYKASPWAESVIEYMLYALWDMGLKVGHAFRTVASCLSLSKTDVTIKTSLLDARFLVGDRALSEDLVEQFQTACVDGEDAQFISDKLAERDERHAKQGDVRYVVEPNVKNGKGGLRDLQTIFWITKHIHGGISFEEVMNKGILTPHEYKVFIRAARFLWTVRCHLHFLTGRPEERISFDLQPELAKRLGYEDRGERLGVERFMKRYFLAVRDVGGLTRIIAAKLEAAQKKKPQGLRRFIPQSAPTPVPNTPFVVDTGRLSITTTDVFENNPEEMLRLFVVAAEEDIDIHPDAMSAVSRSVKSFRRDMRKSDGARAMFLTCLLGSAYPADLLRKMNETGILGQFLPEFGGIVAQTQFNMYHHFTVDEHTLRAIEVMSDIEHGRSPEHAYVTSIFGEVLNRRALYLAMLLHDTGKGKGDQQIEGMRTSRKACKRLGLSKIETELVAWLVGNHLEMSETAQKRDISDPRTVADFASLVGDTERLRLLHILTAADITAVGPKVWNGWKGQLLSDLHLNTVAALRGGRTDEGSVAVDLAERAEARRSEVTDLIGNLPPAMIQMEPAYWTGFEVDTLASHAKLFSQTGDISVTTHVREDGGGVTLLVSGPDRLGLFADLASQIAAEGADIASAQVFTSASGYIIDVFTLQDEDGGPFADGETRRLERLIKSVKDVFEQSEAPRELKSPKRGQREAAFLVQAAVDIDALASTRFTVIDVTARNRPGLLRDVARVVAEHGLSIHSAHVGSYGERVFDAFYVQTKDGQKLTDEALKETLKTHLLAILSSEEPDAPATPIRKLARARASDNF